MAYKTLLIEKKEGIGKITLNRPKVLNAINTTMLAELNQVFTEMDGDDEIHVIIITGVGKAFSAGLDLKDIANAFHSAKGNVYSAVENITKPVIAAVNGYCYTGALELVLCFDLIIASEEAVFADTHARYGLLHGGGGTQRLPLAVGARKAKELLFTCEPISAAQAERIGLVNKVVPADKLAEEAEALAQKIIHNSQHSVRTIKNLVDQGIKHGLAAGLELETREFTKYIEKGTPEEVKKRIEGFNKKG